MVGKEQIQISKDLSEQLDFDSFPKDDISRDWGQLDILGRGGAFYSSRSEQ